MVICGQWIQATDSLAGWSRLVLVSDAGPEDPETMEWKSSSGW